MTRINKRSHFNVNRVHTYTGVDAIMDNPHLPAREAVKLARPARKRPLRDLLTGRRPVTFLCESTPPSPILG